LKILHIITRLILGGAQENTVISCEAQTKNNHQVALIFGPIYGPEGSLLSEAQQTGAELIELSWMRRPILPLHDWMCYRQLRQQIRRFQPDIVHTHSSKAGILGRAAAWAEKVPGIIHTVHGLPFHERQPFWINNLYIYLERWAAQRCHKILGVTQKMCDSFQKHGIGSASQFEVVPSGIRLSDYSPSSDARLSIRRSLNIPDEAPVVGLVARLDKLKGQDDLLDTAKELIEEFPAIRFLFVGDGWYRAALQDRVAKEGLRGHVIFTGLVARRQVANYMAAMDVNTLPSYQEGQPRTLVQALLCGCGIVGYKAGGIPEICIDGQTGLLAPVGDRDALRKAISALLREPSLRTRLNRNGIVHAKKQFDAELMVQKLETIYHTVLEKNGIKLRLNA